MKGTEEYELKYKNKIDKTIQNNPDKPYLKGFYNYMGNRMAISTKYDYINYVVNFINFINKDITDLNLDDYTNFLSQIETKTPSYQISVYSGLKKFANYLLDSNKVFDNPMQKIARPSFFEEEETISKREVGFLEKKEIKKYLLTVENGTGTSRAKARQECWKERDMLIVLLFLSTGMRCSALYKLDIESIDLNEQVLITNEKGKKIRKHDLSDELVESVSKWLQKRYNILGDVQENALFISNQKTRMDQSSISRVVKKYSSEISNKNITPHKLRATYGTQLLKATNDIYFVQDCMGHSNPKTTELYIRGQKQENRKKASEIMSKIVM